MNDTLVVDSTGGTYVPKDNCCMSLSESVTVIATLFPESNDRAVDMKLKYEWMASHTEAQRKDLGCAPFYWLNGKKPPTPGSPSEAAEHAHSEESSSESTCRAESVAISVTAKTLEEPEQSNCEKAANECDLEDATPSLPDVTAAQRSVKRARSLSADEDGDSITADGKAPDAKRVKTSSSDPV